MRVLIFCVILVLLGIGTVTGIAALNDVVFANESAAYIGRQIEE